MNTWLIGLGTILVIAFVIIFAKYMNDSSTCIVQPNPAPVVKTSCPVCSCPVYEEQDCWQEVSEDIVEAKRMINRAEALIE